MFVCAYRVCERASVLSSGHMPTTDTLDIPLATVLQVLVQASRQAGLRSGMRVPMCCKMHLDNFCLQVKSVEHCSLHSEHNVPCLPVALQHQHMMVTDGNTMAVSQTCWQCRHETHQICTSADTLKAFEAPHSKSTGCASTLYRQKGGRGQ